MEIITPLAIALKHGGYSMTKPRQIVFETLLQVDALTMTDLVNKCAPHIDRASVYRSVELFEKLGIIQRVQLGWKYKLELTDQFSPHHHHAVCVQCGAISAIQEHPQLEYELRLLAKINGFVSSTHQLEIRGLCNRCQLEPTSVKHAII